MAHNSPHGIDLEKQSPTLLDQLTKTSETFSYLSFIRIDLLPEIKDIQCFEKNVNCNKCKKKTLKIISFNKNNSLACLYLKCTSCSTPEYKTFSKLVVGNTNRTIIYHSLSKKESSLNDLKKTPCPLCTGRSDIEPKPKFRTKEIQQLYPLYHYCREKNCKYRISIIFHATPHHFYLTSMKLANEISDSLALAKIPFLVAALETFLQKAYLLSSTKNLEKYKNKRINFQDLEISNKIYQESFGINLKGILNQNKWSVLKDAFQKRHLIIHNSGLDSFFMEIKATEEQVIKYKNVIEEFELNLYKTMLNKFIF